MLHQKNKVNLDSFRSVWTSTAAAVAVKRRRDSGKPRTSSGSVSTNENAFVASKTLLLLEYNSKPVCKRNTASPRTSGSRSGTYIV